MREARNSSKPMLILRRESVSGTRSLGLAENQATYERLRCWLLLSIGDAWGQARQWEKAHNAYRSALEAAQNPLSRVAVWRAIGYAYEKASEFEAAREAYGSALEIREKTWGETLAFSRGLTDLGVLDLRQGRLDAAQGRNQRALEIRRELAPGSLDVARSLNNLGILARQRGDLDRAADYYARSLKILQKLSPSSLDVAASLNSLGNLVSDRGDLDRAADYYQRSLDIRQKLAPGSLDVATSLNNLGILARIRGDLDRAVEYNEGSLEIKQKLAPGSLNVAASLNNLGIVAYSRGNLDHATEYFDGALEIKQKLAPGSLNVAASLNNLGMVAYARGDLDRAAEYYERHLEITQRLASGSLEAATSLDNLGIVAYARSQLDRSADYFEESLEIRRKLAPSSLNVAASLNNLGVVAHASGDLDRAVEFLEGSLEIKQKLVPGSLDLAATLNNLGVLARKRGDLDRAGEYFEQDLEITQKLAPGSSGEAETLHNLATVRRMKNQPQPALTLFLRSLYALENQVDRLGGSRDTQAGFRAERIAYYRDAIDLSLELQRVAEAFHTLERSRAQGFLAQLTERDLAFSDVPEDLERQRRRIVHRYDQAQDEIARLHPREQAEEIKTLLNRLRQLRHDHEDITEKIIKASPRFGALRYPRPFDHAAARDALDSGTVMLSYSVGEHDTHLFVLGHEEELQVKTLHLGVQDLRQEVGNILKLQKRVSPPLYTDPMRQAGERLYHALIRPAEEAIARSERILIVPDGPLHMLPFALLNRKIDPKKSRGGRDFEYLVEWKPLHLALSATVYAEFRDQRESQSNGASDALALAAFGDPRYPPQKSGEALATDNSLDVYVRAALRRGFDFRPLPYSREEVTRSAALYPRGAARAFVGAEASEEQAKAIGKSARILHFATHGRYDDRIPINSYLAMTIPDELRKNQDNGLLQTWEIFEDVRLDADLVVLSACESGLGDEVGGEGLIGLTRAFQFAGARTVISSLWQVEDQATTELMVRFYRHLLAGASKDEALRAAQLELIQGPVEIKDPQGRSVERDLSLPYYWAAFQMNGDWK